MNQLDQLSQKVAKALYVIQNLKSENESLKNKVAKLEANNAELEEKISSNNSNLEEATQRVEGILESLKVLDSVDEESEEEDVEWEEVEWEEESEEESEESEEEESDDPQMELVEENENQETLPLDEEESLPY